MYLSETSPSVISFATDCAAELPLINASDPNTKVGVGGGGGGVCAEQVLAFCAERFRLLFPRTRNVRTGMSHGTKIVLILGFAWVQIIVWRTRSVTPSPSSSGCLALSSVHCDRS